MQSINLSKIELSIKDSTKGQKIAAALYLVTDHLSDTDPLRGALRAHAVTVMQNLSADRAQTLALEITSLMNMAVMARLISEKNASILVLELRHFATLLASEGDLLTDSLQTHFATDTSSQIGGVVAPKKTSLSLGQSLSRALAHTPVPTKPATTVQGIKSNRQDQILSLINERKSAGIKDIAGLFPDTSEKTIQRELGALVASGRITKRGQKRWSVYMAVNA